MNALKQQLETYYRSMSYEEENGVPRFERNPAFVELREAVHREMDAYRAAHPEAAAVTLKSELHRTIAALFRPVIFDETPFFFEMGVRAAENWGYTDRRSVSCWGVDPAVDEAHLLDPDIVSLNFSDTGLGYATGKAFDTDHHCPGYRLLFRVGVEGILRSVQEKLAQPDAEKTPFWQAVQTSCRAVLHVAESFAAEAERQLRTCEDARKRANLEQIRVTARKIPHRPPETFYEGLAMLWFIREVTASLEGVGISVLGRVDQLLGPLYEADCRRGTLCREEAKRLLGLWLLPTHVKFHAETDSWADSSTCIELGGCDENGVPVFNEVTRLILEVHEEQNFVIPKLNCRLGKRSPKEYVELLCRGLLKGRNVYSILNDESIIPALVRNGKTWEDARNYVNGGCQETMVEGAEHSAGALFYFNTARVLELSLCGVPSAVSVTSKTRAYLPVEIRAPRSFEEVYETFLHNVKNAIRGSVEVRRPYGEQWRNIHPCPFFSATLRGCLENGFDYTAGGAAYNRSTLCVSGLGTVIDSLYAIQKAVFEEKTVSYETLVEALKADWNGYAELRRAMIAQPKYCHGDPAVDRLADRFIGDLNAYVKTLENERGETYQLSMFTYIYFKYEGAASGASPDGRKRGDCVSQGVGAGRLRAPACVLDSIRSVGEISSFRETGGVNVLDINLPYTSQMTPGILAALLDTFLSGAGHSLQLNCVSRERLREAQKDPERHRDLIVRLCGFSAYFVNLSPDIQEEFLHRNFYTR